MHWLPAIGLENGHLRFVRDGGPGATPAPAAAFDPYSLDLWGLSKKEYTAVLVAAAVLVRLPEAAQAVAAVESAAEPAPIPAPADDHDVLLRRLRELGELHRAGVLTDDEFTAAKQAVLKRL